MLQMVLLFIIIIIITHLSIKQAYHLISGKLERLKPHTYPFT